MSHQRERIREYVRREPGVHFRGLVRDLDLAPGQVQYHLRKLGGSVVAADLCGRTHYYPPEYDEWERGALALLRRETARDVLVTLLEHGPARPEAVADEVGIARSTLEWHLDNLTERDLVAKHRDHQDRVTLVLVRPGETAALLAEIEPSLPERLVDRFTRLVDDALAERSAEGTPEAEEE